jgi:molybdopterin/thiamine biosynthesis adenylyltransferase
MIGAGAIGCELLKNFAMIGLGSGAKGKITLTDPDIIELSNLNRQFLFREKHIRKPKAMVAAAAAIQMNPNLRNHVSARLDKIHRDTESIYSEEFYKKQTVIANALDNVKARIFIDAKAVQARVPLLDSGTLGPKGHV